MFPFFSLSSVHPSFLSVECVCGHVWDVECAVGCEQLPVFSCGVLHGVCVCPRSRDEERVEI